MNRFRKAALGAAVLGATLTGGAVGAAFLGGTANAADSTTVTADSSSSTAGGAGASAATPAADASTPTPPADGQRGPGGPGGPDGPGGTFDPSKGGHQANGITETILTGDTADQVTAAATAAVPGATIERVETDAEGATYEAHIVKSDGSHVTVKLGADFSVSSIEDGMK